jgi:hypothetical protein
MCDQEQIRWKGINMGSKVIDVKRNLQESIWKFFNFDSENGSLSVLISGLFLLVLTLSIGILDISDTYLAKRELIQIGEAALGPAAHAIDLARYYQEGALSSGRRVPLDCTAARTIIQNEIMQRTLRDAVIDISSWRCESDQMSVTLHSSVLPLVNFPLLSQITGPRISVVATVGAGSIVK